jgi:membrane protease subunit HflC
MKRNLITIITAAVLAVIFVLLLFTFQVRQSEVAVVTTFGKITGQPRDPGLHLRWPWPIQAVYKFDKRIQNFHDKFEESMTADNINLITTVYVGWRISNPSDFLNSFQGGSVAIAQNQLESLLRSADMTAVSKHNLSDFVNADPKLLKFDEIQSQIEQMVQDKLRTNSYGIQIEFLGLNGMELPQAVTEAVFTRMKSERQVLISQADSFGKSEAIKIRANADRQANITLATAEGEANRIKGEGVAEAAKTLPIFQQNPDLAVFMLRIDALKAALNQKATLIFDQRTPPFDLFQGSLTNSLMH